MRQVWINPIGAVRQVKETKSPDLLERVQSSREKVWQLEQWDSCNSLGFFVSQETNAQDLILINLDQASLSNISVEQAKETHRKI